MGQWPRAALVGIAALAMASCAPTPEDASAPEVKATINTLTITGSNEMQWNGQVVSNEELAILLYQTRALPAEPELRFEPSLNADYETSAEVLRIIKQSGVTGFGFVGNEKYRSGDAEQD